MAVYQTNRHRCLAVLVSYRFGVFQAQHGLVGAIGGYDGGEGGVSDEPPSQPRVARQLLQVRRFQAQHGSVGAIGGYDGREGGV